MINPDRENMYKFADSYMKAQVAKKSKINQANEKKALKVLPEIVDKVNRALKNGVAPQIDLQDKDVDEGVAKYLKIYIQAGHRDWKVTISQSDGGGYILNVSKLGAENQPPGGPAVKNDEEVPKIQPRQSKLRRGKATKEQIVEMTKAKMLEKIAARGENRAPGGPGVKNEPENVLGDIPMLFGEEPHLRAAERKKRKENE